MAGLKASACTSPRGVLLVGTRPQRGGGPPPPLWTPILSHGTMCFVGAGDFVLGIRQGEFFFVRPYVSLLKILRILWRIQKWLKSTMILPPALKRWGSPRRQGLRSHLAHKWATSDSTPRSKALGLPEAAGVT